MVIRQQISYLFVVELQEAGAAQKLHSPFGSPNEFEDVVEAVGNDTTQLWRLAATLHRPGLSGASLAICVDKDKRKCEGSRYFQQTKRGAVAVYTSILTSKDSAIVASKHILNERKSHVLVKHLLSAVGAVYMIESERLRFGLLREVLDGYLAGRPVDIDAILSSFSLLFGIGRPAAHGDLHCFPGSRHPVIQCASFARPSQLCLPEIPQEQVEAADTTDGQLAAALDTTKPLNMKTISASG
jgi:hypothetical protein